MKHILLQHSKRYTDPKTIDIPNEFTFDSDKGYWIKKNDGYPMMQGYNSPILISKKWDRETGEDQKGE